MEWEFKLFSSIYMHEFLENLDMPIFKTTQMILRLIQEKLLNSVCDCSSSKKAWPGINASKLYYHLFKKVISFLQQKKGYLLYNPTFYNKNMRYDVFGENIKLFDLEKEIQFLAVQIFWKI